jgi:hypothetical protein
MVQYVCICVCPIGKYNRQILFQTYFDFACIFPNTVREIMIYDQRKVRKNLKVNSFDNFSVVLAYLILSSCNTSSAPYKHSSVISIFTFNSRHQLAIYLTIDKVKAILPNTC